MIINSLEMRNTNFQSQMPRDNKTRDIAVGFLTGALVSPLLPLIDGDSFKTAYKNRSVLKMTVGFAALGGGLVGTKMLTDKFADNKKKSIAQYSLFGGIAVPLSMLVDKWAQKNKKTLASKWYFLGTLSGAAVGAISKYTDTK